MGKVIEMNKQEVKEIFCECDDCTDEAMCNECEERSLAAVAIDQLEDIAGVKIPPNKGHRNFAYKVVYHAMTFRDQDVFIDALLTECFNYLHNGFCDEMEKE